MALERFRFSKDGRKILQCCDRFIEKCVVPDHVTSIGPYAFDGCEHLRTIKLPDTLSRINQGAFYKCTGLKKIDLPDSLRAIGKRAFAASGLKKIRIPAKAKLANGVFDDSEHLEEISFADGAKVVPAGLTFRLRKTPKIVLPDSIEEIGAGAFEECGDLDEFEIPAKLKRIGRFAFMNCSALKELHLPEGIEIGAGAFQGCGNLELYLPADAVIRELEYEPEDFIINYSTFSGVGKIHLADGKNPRISKNGKGDLLHRNGMLIRGTTNADGEVDTSEFGSIGAGAYEGNPQVRRIYRDEFSDNVFGEGVKIIFPYAFKDCINLRWAYLDGFETIGGGAFSGCSRLKIVYLYDRLKKIGHRAFKDCGRLTSICISRLCESIGREAFSGCSALQEIIFYSPDHIPFMDDFVFKNCTSLKTVSISDKDAYLSNGLCAGCTSLTDVHIPYGIEYIGTAAFKDCTSLRKIALPESLREIGRSAFRGCSSLTDINISDSVKSISSWAFADCSSLTFLDLSEVEYIGPEAFANCTSLKYAVVSHAANYRKDSFPEWCKVAKLSY